MQVPSIGAVTPQRTEPESVGRGPGSAVAAAPAAGGPAGAEAAGEAATRAGVPYVSPILRYDTTARLAILAFRDQETGEVVDKIPPERVIEQYRRAGFRSAAGVADPTAGVILPPGYHLPFETNPHAAGTEPTGGAVSAAGATGAAAEPTVTGRDAVPAALEASSGGARSGTGVSEP